MCHRTIAAISAAALLALAGCAGGGGPPSEERNADGPSATVASPGPTEPSLAKPPTGSATASVPDPTDPAQRDLLRIVRDEDTVSVIVAAAMDGTAERGSAAHDRLVTEAQDAIEAELDPDHAQVTNRFESSARLTLAVDEEGLRALFASPRVADVWENRTISLD